MTFGYYFVPIPIVFTRIFLSSATGSGNQNNLKVGLYYLCSQVQDFFLNLFRGG